MRAVKDFSIVININRIKRIEAWIIFMALTKSTGPIAEILLYMIIFDFNANVMQPFVENFFAIYAYNDKAGAKLFKKQCFFFVDCSAICM